MFTVSIVLLIALYLSSFLQIMRELPPEEEVSRWKWLLKLFSDSDDVNDSYNLWAYWTFIGGINYQNDKRHYSFFYQSLGYILMIMLLVIERKSEVWINTRFGCEQNTMEYLEEMEEASKE
jgi:hypothetical protein